MLPEDVQPHFSSQTRTAPQVQAWMGWGRARGKPAYGTAVGIFTSPDGVREGSGEASLRHCGKNFYVSGWGGGGLGGSQPTALR